MADPFESAWLKWAGGVINAQVLGENVNAFASQPNLHIPVTMRQEYDAKSHCIVLSVEEIANPFPPLWGVLLGDVVHDLRSALDHLAWTLYKRGNTPNLSDKLERHVLFPISDDRVRYNDSLRRKLPGVRRADLKLVRKFQPYHAPKRLLLRHALFVLDELSRYDKHRTIQPVVPVPERSGYKILGATDCIYRRMRLRIPRGALEVGMELTRFYVKKTGPEPYLDVEPHFTIDPTVYHARLTLEEFLKTTIRGAGLVLREFAEPPASVHQVVDRPLSYLQSRRPRQQRPSPSTG
jgi:hypothetical protein